MNSPTFSRRQATMLSSARIGPGVTSWKTSRREGFTMVEIALSLAVLAFALVAIIGVLPTGLKVQQENNDETIITQEGMYLLEAIRNGTGGSEALRDQIDFIAVSNRLGRRFYSGNGGFVPLEGTNNMPRLLTSMQALTLLTTPKYVRRPDGIVTNSVYAHVKAITGPAVARDPFLNEVAFRYLLRSEVVPLELFPPEQTNFHRSGLTTAEIVTRSNNWRQAINAASNTFEVRLTLQWPLIFQTGAKRQDVGGNIKTFRTTVSGRIAETNLFEGLLYTLQPGQFTRMP